jgi:hypothetical protein
MSPVTWEPDTASPDEACVVFATTVVFDPFCCAEALPGPEAWGPDVTTVSPKALALPDVAAEFTALFWFCTLPEPPPAAVTWLPATASPDFALVDELELAWLLPICCACALPPPELALGPEPVEEKLAALASPDCAELFWDVFWFCTAVSARALAGATNVAAASPAAATILRIGSISVLLASSFVGVLDGRGRRT